MQKKIMRSLDIEFWDNTSTKHLSPAKLVKSGQITLNYIRKGTECEPKLSRLHFNLYKCVAWFLDSHNKMRF